MLLYSKVNQLHIWQPTLVFLPGESNGQKSMEGCSQSGHKQSDTTEVTKHILTQGMARQG